MAEHLSLGAWGEEAAAGFLKDQGYDILERNWRCGNLELDIVARKGEEVVFVEVKTRSSSRLGTPAQAVGPKKAARLLEAVHRYLSEHGLWRLPCRLDIIAVLKTNTGLELEHIPHALDLGDPVAGGHSAWQPW